MTIRKAEFSITFVGAVDVAKTKRYVEMPDEDFSNILQLSFLTTFGPLIECLIKAEKGEESSVNLSFADFEQTAVEVAKLTGLGTNENILRLGVRAISDFSNTATSARLEDILEKLQNDLSEESPEKSSGVG